MRMRKANLRFYALQGELSIQPFGDCARSGAAELGQITKMLHPILAGKAGVAALVDADGQILACAENSGRGNRLIYGKRGQHGRLHRGRKLENRQPCHLQHQPSCNGWRIVAAVPGSVLTAQIGDTRYVTMVLCFVSVFIGMIVCLAYWHQRKGMVQEFFDLKDRRSGKTIQKEKNFDSGAVLTAS